MSHLKLPSAALLTSVLLALLLGGCAAFEPTEDGDEIDGPSFVLEIENDSFQDARISVFWNGTSQSLGRVRANTMSTFTLPYRGNQIRIRVDYTEGGGREDSSPIELNPDQVIRYRIDG